MWSEITQHAYESAIAGLTPVAGGALFNGGEFTEYGIGGVAMFRTERVSGESRYYVFAATARH